MRYWIGVDLDGTLAKGDGRLGPDAIGEPIPAMVERVKAWLAEGRDVRIFTARVAETGLVKPSGFVADLEHCQAHRIGIELWCLQHLGRTLQVTAIKDAWMEVLYDDRARQVETNTGRLIGETAYRNFTVGKVLL